MGSKYRFVAAILTAFALASATASDRLAVVHPSKISVDDTQGAIFERPDTLETHHEDGHETLDVTTLLSSDKKFASGMYRSGKTRSVIRKPYGVDEFMYFIDGGVRLTSSDGTVTEVNAGEAVTIPKEWTGIWETDGYTKIWVIYSADGSGLE